MIVAVRQRTATDCGIAALSMLTARPYEEIAALVPRTDGLHNRELVAIAGELGVSLAPAKTYDLDADEGVLRVRSATHHRHGHFVTVRYRLVWDPADGSARPWREYLHRYGARAGTLLRPQG